jgi:hypothetical protein
LMAVVAVPAGCCFATGGGTWPRSAGRAHQPSGECRIHHPRRAYGRAFRDPRGRRF